MRSMGFLVYFDTAEAIQGFKTLGTFFVFFSYQWLSCGQAGPDAIQFYAVTESLKIIAARLRLDMEGIYFLLGFFSGAQATTWGHTPTTLPRAIHFGHAGRHQGSACLRLQDYFLQLPMALLEPTRPRPSHCGSHPGRQGTRDVTESLVALRRRPGATLFFRGA